MRPVGVLGSTFVRMSDVETVKMSGGDGYLKNLEGPLGCKNVRFRVFSVYAKYKR